METTTLLCQTMVRCKNYDGQIPQMQDIIFDGEGRYKCKIAEQSGTGECPYIVMINAISSIERLMDKNRLEAEVTA